MKRIQLFELEDFNWFPSWLRTCMTNLLNIVNGVMGVDKVVAKIISEIYNENDFGSLVDLGSGSGGAMPEVLKILSEKYGFKKMELTLTDLYPNPEMVQKFREDKYDRISYYDKPVDATDFENTPEGLKTMINCFHHMPPKSARKILESAHSNRQPILIYEMGENNIPLLIWWILLPISLIILMISVLLMTPFVRPMTWQQLVFTYLIPIIPICYAWDGQASLPRIYALSDFNELLRGLETEDYSWKKGQAKKENGKKRGVFLIGLPIS